MQSKRKADHLTTASTGVKNGWRCTSTPPLSLCLHNAYSDYCATFLVYHTFNVHFLMGTTTKAGNPTSRSGHPTCALNELSTGDKDGQLTAIEHPGQLDQWSFRRQVDEACFHTHGHWTRRTKAVDIRGHFLYPNEGWNGQMTKEIPSRTSFAWKCKNDTNGTEGVSYHGLGFHSYVPGYH
jgi:hypothetical protein